MALEPGRKAFIVLGLGFGDEGKGLATDYLCRVSPTPLVIRFNGGHQAGHTVVTPSGISHIFSTFGAGTLRNIPTYWSKYCTFSTFVLLPEFESLPIKPKLYVDGLCPVTTHYDVLYNRALESSRGAKRYGSCGVGFGATVDRHGIESLGLCFHDLFSATLLKEYLFRIRNYYKIKIERETSYDFNSFNHDEADMNFQKQVSDVIKLVQEGAIEMVNENDILSLNRPWETFIFEGAQGILIDKKYGFQPHITKSNTTSENAFKIINSHLPSLIESIRVVYVTRGYLTRHGAGPMPTLGIQLDLTHQEDETNSYNPYQGEVRITHLDIDLLNYSISCDNNFSKDNRKWLLVTCLDQLDAKNMKVCSKGELITIVYNDISKLLDFEFEKCLFSFSSCADYLA